MSLERRLQRIEGQCWRDETARILAAMQAPFSVDPVLDEAIRFLTMPPDQQRHEYPNFTEAERREMSTWLPAIRRARWAHRRAPE
jgi:hypothetical protein